MTRMKRITTDYIYSLFHILSVKISVICVIRVLFLISPVLGIFPCPNFKSLTNKVH